LTQNMIRILLLTTRFLVHVSEHSKYSGNRLRSTPRDQEKVLTLSEVDLIRIQRHVVKYSQVFNSVI